MGIDPGTTVMGYGIIRTSGQIMELLSMGSIHLSKYKNHQLKLKNIFERMTYLIGEYKPDFCAIESPFYGKNVQSMLKLGRAQGVCMAAVLTKDIPVVEYSPKKIKLAITGNGNASKQQVAAMLQRLCEFEERPKFLDATDALATAVCHHFQGSLGSENHTSFRNWTDFLKNNPERIK